MKVIGINGSPKGARSQTLKLVNSVLEGARRAGADIEFLDLCKMNISYCVGCDTCHVKGRCIHADDMERVVSKMMESEGFVLGSPVYMDAVTGQMKTFLDRLTDTVYCQSFLGKYGCAVATTEYSGLNEVLGYLSSIMQRMGASTVGAVGAAVGDDSAAIFQADRRAFEMGRELVNAIRAKRRYPDQERTRAAFMGRMKHVILKHKEDWFHDYQYWKSMGWLEE